MYQIGTEIERDHSIVHVRVMSFFFASEHCQYAMDYYKNDVSSEVRFSWEPAHTFPTTRQFYTHIWLIPYTLRSPMAQSGI